MRIRPQPAVPHTSRGHALPTEALLTAAVLAALAASVPAQRQFDELRKRGFPADTDPSRAVAVGDVDGDGDLDIVFGNDGQQNRLYLNDGSGGYTDATAHLPADNDSSRAVALGDVDRDGDIDIVIGNSHYKWPQQNRLYLNDGSGIFSDATAARMPVVRDFTSAVALGDVDQDGDLDLIIGNGDTFSGGRQNWLHLNDGSGTYTNATAARMPTDRDVTHAVVLGDVDGDGDIDIVCGNGESRYSTALTQNRLYVNDGSGNYMDATASRMPADADRTQAVAVGDVDGDGDLDIVFGNGVQNRLYLNDGTGAYVDATTTRLPAGGAGSVALGDVDGDGDLDIVLGGGPNKLYLNDGSGTYIDATTARLPAGDPGSPALGDVDADGDLDIVFATNAQNRLYLNDGNGYYSIATTAPARTASAYDTQALALGDVDGDGDLDMISGNAWQQNRLYINDGSGNYFDATATQMPIEFDSTFDVAMGDVDGDGDLDAVIGNAGYAIWRSIRNLLYLNDGSGTFINVTATQLPYDANHTEAVGLGDVDGDGDLDIVCGNYGQQNTLYLNDGSGTYTDATATHMPIARDSTRAVALGDVDGDGDIDMTFGNSDFLYGHQNRLYLNDGSGNYTDATAARMPTDRDGTRSVALGDVDGDGDLDMVLGNEYTVTGSPQNRLYLNDGSGTFADATAVRVPVDTDDTTTASLGDVDGDGDIDIVLGNDHGQPNRLYLNDGSGAFIDASAARIPAERHHTQTTILGDVDRDGDFDIIVGNDGQNRLYRNLLRQLDAPLLADIGRPYTLEAYSRYGPPSLVDVALPFISTATATVPFPPFGTIGVEPSQMLAISPFVIPQPAGLSSVSFTVPNLPALIGASVYAQALLVPYPLQARLTNITADVVIR